MSSRPVFHQVDTPASTTSTVSFGQRRHVFDLLLTRFASVLGRVDFLRGKSADEMLVIPQDFRAAIGPVCLVSNLNLQVRLARFLD